MRFRGRAALTCCLIGMLASAGCAREDRAIQQHQEALQSCAATVHAIAAAWLDGRVSGTYAHTALERTLALVEQERAAVASQPRLLIDERGARVSDAAHDLERLIAAMMHAVRGADAAGVRDALAELPFDRKPRQP